MQHFFSSESDTYKCISLASGSSGNCYFLGNNKMGILIDAGINFRTIKKSLHEHGISIQNIVAILITHEHADHIRGVCGIISKLHIPIYATAATLQAIRKNPYLNPKSVIITGREITKETPFSIFGLEIVAFTVPHDSIDNVGYHFRFGKNQTCTIATDVGCITPQIEHYSRLAQHLIIESNYDEQMLKNGNYPIHLQRRISSGIGHLSNQQTANFLKKIYSPHLTEVWLCHLSADNNRPEIAYRTIGEALHSIGIDITKDINIQALLRGKPSKAKEYQHVY